MISYKLNRIRLLFSSIFLFVSIAMFCGMSAILLDWYAHKDTYVAVQAVIVDIETERHGSRTRHGVIVAYEFEGERYESELGHYSSAMRRGDTVEILCDPEDPQKTMTSPWTMVMIFGLLGTVTGGVGVGVLAYELRKRGFAKRLIHSGSFVYADFEREEPASVRVNGVDYCRAVFVYIDPCGVRYEFASEAYHPRKFPYSDGEPVRVYVDIKDPKHYYIPEVSSDFDAT